MDPMTAGRKIRLHVELFEQKERKEGTLHICWECMDYTEDPILLYMDYRFYPYCSSCIQVYFQPIKIDASYPLRNMYHVHRNGSRT
jgi:hypothetical protein